MDNKIARITCIYHGNCADGFGAAWVVHDALGSTHDITFHAATYGSPPPDVSGEEVIIVDFSYPLDVMRDMVAQCTSFTILDHHVTAKEAIKALTEENKDNTRVSGEYSETMSGCMLAWDWFATPRTPPQLLKHIEDRDLWLFELSGTKEIMAAVFSYDYKFSVWDQLMATSIDGLARQGNHLLRQHTKHVNALIEMGTTRMDLDEYNVPAVNAPPFFASDIGHILCQGESFAATYHDVNGKRNWSLRSSPDGVDVSEVAKRFGGGGHKHAAGFTTEL